MKKKIHTKTRRNFLATAFIVGLAGYLGLHKKPETPVQEEEMITMITADGQLVEIPKKRLPKASGKPISDAELDRFKKSDMKHRMRIQKANNKEIKAT